MTFRSICLSYLAIWNIFLVLPIVTSDNDYISGYRRRLHPMTPMSWTKDGDTAENMVKTINIWIEEQARRRFLKHLQSMQAASSKPAPIPSFADPGVTYTYQLPLSNQINSVEPINFAVGPSDPRFYDQASGVAREPDLEDDETDVDDGFPYRSGPEPDAERPKDHRRESELTNDAEPIMDQDLVYGYRHPPPPPPIRPKLGKGTHMRNQANAKNTLTTPAPGGSQLVDRRNSNGVVQQPIELGTGLGMYLIALIAGISAAITVALISIGFGWYTLHKRTKAAADVEYPAYGVTGPNRDSTAGSTAAAAGDRKLAQNAQMYHYQHQKQQIIAMENTTRSANHSEQPSEDENEEGDYTVYECPGLAPTGEMEVKNPLFLEEGPVNGVSLQPSISGEGPALGVVYLEKPVQPQAHNNNKKSGT
ncbi:neural proliferation differentiation and control protein 1 [Anopheles ziemanni]|uniref:neural proliferation differentiation and control protein 1 n=1 Tax=Anopheles coustani TaxID=139045 RepID=UPI00265A82AD|nr:neural proliferation differentiation and control protein 1 [Anopheles coustani]XP_058177607.1 neural proliferation differentiation and control protein 1 [Anopheles ziemanni]